MDSAGNVIIADSVNNEVRVVAAKTGTYYGQAMTAGDIYGLAGHSVMGHSGDGGPATAAELRRPIDVALDARGDLFIADAWNNRVRMVPAVSGTYFGQAMTAGDIYTVAGTGDKGFSGDHGPGPAAELSFPTGVAVTPAGNLMIGDTYDNRIREVAVAVAG